MGAVPGGRHCDRDSILEDAEKRAARQKKDWCLLKAKDVRVCANSFCGRDRDVRGAQVVLEKARLAAWLCASAACQSVVVAFVCVSVRVCVDERDAL